METILVNPRRKKKRVRKNAEEILLVNPKKRKKARKNVINELLLVNPGRKRRKARKNPVHGGINPKGALGAMVGGMLQGISERFLSTIKSQDGRELIPEPIRIAALPIISYILSGAIPYGEEIALGAIGSAGNKIGTKLLQIALPQTMKQKLGLSGSDDVIPEIEGIFTENPVRELIPVEIPEKSKIPVRVTFRPSVEFMPVFEPSKQRLNLGSK